MSSTPPRGHQIKLSVVGKTDRIKSNTQKKGRFKKEIKNSNLLSRAPHRDPRRPGHARGQGIHHQLDLPGQVQSRAAAGRGVVPQQRGWRKKIFFVSCAGCLKVKTYCQPRYEREKNDSSKEDSHFSLALKLPFSVLERERIFLFQKISP